MTNLEMARMINKTAKAAIKSIKSTMPADTKAVEINYSLPYVAIVCPDSSEYFFQGEEAENLLEQAIATSNKFNVTVDNVLIWQSQGW